MKMHTTLRTLLGALLLGMFVVTTGCNRAADNDGMNADSLAAADTAMAVPSETVTMSPTEGNTVQGTLTVMDHGDALHLSGTLTGLTPGEHGIHIHEFGDCSAPDAKSAGDHYNPAGATHAGPDTPVDQRHAGDLGNITADASGAAAVDKMFPGLTLSGANAVAGRAIVVHASADDLKTDPSGNSGARQACGVIPGMAAGMAADSSAAGHSM